ncbi:hypothetical protein RHGRI_035645 [Rhododendron griersonianum]|uniref:Uncharacterized protein n=1 Tax=Rhododendron griersonianum TaxID=479676 RepID=A0AAV6HJZ7_9ERIC|nr:hypothetical protein RHGRI_035645 [Rhododendron griersonianum]
MEVFRKCGWSEDDFQLAFNKVPLFMWLSEKKITGTMDFLVHKMGRKPAAFGRARKVLLYSVEESDCPKEWKCFLIGLSVIVTKYEEDVPQLLHVFNGKGRLAELGL